MTVEIWSDVTCPFCYIGKRKFENALKKFDNRDRIKILWHSFQLSPKTKTDPAVNVAEHLAKQKGWTLEFAQKAHTRVTAIAKEVGLIFRFEKAVIANSLNAHRLSHLASKFNMQHELHERLFSAYFTEGKNIDDDTTLIQIGTDTGLPAEEIQKMLRSQIYADKVREDIIAAQQIGVHGVPFFVINSKYAVSGAQPSEVFLNALETAWQEKTDPNKSLETDGPLCMIDGNC
ncbi:MAG: DsbA family oxidoreductase [Balneolales bacterium]